MLKSVKNNKISEDVKNASKNYIKSVGEIGFKSGGSGFAKGATEMDRGTSGGTKPKKTSRLATIEELGPNVRSIASANIDSYSNGKLESELFGSGKSSQFSGKPVNQMQSVVGGIQRGRGMSGSSKVASGGSNVTVGGAKPPSAWLTLIKKVLSDNPDLKGVKGAIAHIKSNNLYKK